MPTTLDFDLRENLNLLRQDGRLAVLIALVLHANVRGRCWPSVHLLAQETGWAIGSVIEALRWLEGAGAIAKVPYEKRVEEEHELPVRQTVYQLTGRFSAGGKTTFYLYLSPEERASLVAAAAAAMQGKREVSDDQDSTQSPPGATPHDVPADEISPSEISPSEISLAGTEVSTSRSIYRSEVSPPLSSGGGDDVNTSVQVPQSSLQIAPIDEPTPMRICNSLRSGGVYTRAAPRDNARRLRLVTGDMTVNVFLGQARNGYVPLVGDAGWIRIELLSPVDQTDADANIANDAVDTPQHPEASTEAAMAMFDAILAVFGWRMATISKRDEALALDAAERLAANDFKPQDIPAIYEYCNTLAAEQNWSLFGPAAIARYSAYWRQQHVRQQTTANSDKHGAAIEKDYNDAAEKRLAEAIRALGLENQG